MAANEWNVVHCGKAVGDVHFWSYLCHLMEADGQVTEKVATCPP